MMYALILRHDRYPGCTQEDELLGVYSTMEDAGRASARFTAYSGIHGSFVAIECELGKDRPKSSNDEHLIFPCKDLVKELVELKEIEEGLQ